MIVPAGIVIAIVVIYSLFGSLGGNERSIGENLDRVVHGGARYTAPALIDGRLEAAIEASEWDEVDLRAVLRSCVEAYRGVHTGRRIELEVPDEPCLWPCAPDLLAQALDKLVDNALSLTGPEDDVRVRLVRHAEHCQIRVANTGSQLPDVLPEQLFDSLVSMRERGAGRQIGRAHV